MSERQKKVLLAKYYILVNCGMKITESMKAAVKRIESERISRKVATV